MARAYEGSRSARAAFTACYSSLLASAAARKKAASRSRASSSTATQAVTAKQLRSVLATRPSSKLPWGEKHYFSREQFEADLKRIVAFYTRSRLSGRAGHVVRRRSSTTIRPRSTSRSTIAEGEPIRVERIVFDGFEAAAGRHRATLEARLPLKAGAAAGSGAGAGEPRSGARRAASDHGYPYATVRLTRRAGSAERQRVSPCSAEPGPVAHLGHDRHPGQLHVSDESSAASSRSGPASSSSRASCARASAGSTRSSSSSSRTSSRCGPKASRRSRFRRA